MLKLKLFPRARGQQAAAQGSSLPAARFCKVSHAFCLCWCPWLPWCFTGRADWLWETIWTPKPKNIYSQTIHRKSSPTSVLNRVVSPAAQSKHTAPLSHSGTPTIRSKRFGASLEAAWLLWPGCRISPGDQLRRPRSQVVLLCVNVEAAKQGEPGPRGQVCSLQPWRGDGGHWHEEWRVCHLVGEQPESLGEETRPEICYPRYQVHSRQSGQGGERRAFILPPMVPIPGGSWLEWRAHLWEGPFQWANYGRRPSHTLVLRHVFANFHKSVVKNLS